MGMQVGLRRFDRLMTEPQRNYGAIDARFQQLHRALCLSTCGDTRLDANCQSAFKFAPLIGVQAVGGSAERGVVAAARYEARKFGVPSAMPSVTAKRQCPDLIFVKPRFEVYKEINR